MTFMYIRNLIILVGIVYYIRITGKFVRTHTHMYIYIYICVLAYIFIFWYGDGNQSCIIYNVPIFFYCVVLSIRFCLCLWISTTATNITEMLLLIYINTCLFNH